MSNIRRWADEHQYEAAGMQVERTSTGLTVPQVHLLWMTPDPLGAVAAMCRMYEGIPTYDLKQVDDDDRKRYLEQIQKTHLKAPLESVKLHFFIEGVTRAFTHQMVRQRTAVYAQESLRFAVKEHLADDFALPESIASLSSHHPTRQRFFEHLGQVEEIYNFLVNNGIPAEDARSLMPHGVTTRLHYVTDLRNLIEHAGNRLCTQAQFEWRLVFMGIVNAIRQYGTPDDGPWPNSGDHTWQYELIADSPMFRPICYQLGKCQFEADFDRSCTIRDRVNEFAANGVSSDQWDRPHTTPDGVTVQPVHVREWLSDADAARKRS